MAKRLEMIAHPAEDRHKGRHQQLQSHLSGAVGFAVRRLVDLGCLIQCILDVVSYALAGHDVGKATWPFQQYIRADKSGRSGDQRYEPHWSTHADLGAIALYGYFLGREGVQTDTEAQNLLSAYLPYFYLIYRHHSGFRFETPQHIEEVLNCFTGYFLRGDNPDFSCLENERRWKADGEPSKDNPIGKSDIRPPEEKGVVVYFESNFRWILRWLKNENFPIPPPISFKGRSKDRFFEYFCYRASLGAMVYGDGSDTAMYYRRFPDGPFPLGDVSSIVEAYRTKLVNQDASSSNSGIPQQILGYRNQVFDLCRDFQDTGEQFLVLTADTGGAKTIASLALSGALKAKRIVTVLPFLTLINQYVNVVHDLQEGEELPAGSLKWFDVMIAHASSLPKKYQESENYDTNDDVIDPRQDWNSNLVVTTLERLTRVLVGNRNSDMRRMISLFDRETVVICDEIQSLPPHKLYACILILSHLNCRVVFTSATTESVRRVLDLAQKRFQSLNNGQDIITWRDVVLKKGLSKLPPKYFLQWKHLPDGPGSSLALNNQVLSIYNTKAMAYEAFNEIRHLPNTYLYYGDHASKHNKQIIQKVLGHFRNEEPVRLISTQGIEAGIDIDFPRVYRMAGPYYAVLQAGGRCNREGLLAEGGVYVVWWPNNFKHGPGGCFPDKHYARQTHLLLEEIKRRDLQGEPVESETDLKEIGESILRREIDAVEFWDTMSNIDMQFWQLDFSRTCTYTMIRSYLASAVADLDGAHKKILDGQMYRREIPEYYVQVQPDSPLLQQVEITCKGDHFPTKTLFYTGDYSLRTGIRPDLDVSTSNTPPEITTNTLDP